MTQSRKYPAGKQLLILLGIYLLTFVMEGVYYTLIPRWMFGLSYSEFLKADFSIPAYRNCMKLLILLDCLIMYLMPAVLSIALTRQKLTDWLQRATAIRPVLLIVLLTGIILPPVDDYLHGFSTSLMSPEQLNILQLNFDVQKDILHNDSAMDFILSLIVFVVAPAICKIFFFIGVLQPVLIKLMPKLPWVGIFIASIIFAGSYFQLYALFATFVFSYIIGSIYYMTRNIWLPVAVGGVSFSIWLVYYCLYDKGVINSNPFVPMTSSPIPAIIALAAIIALLWFIRKRSPKPEVVDELSEEVGSIGVK